MADQRVDILLSLKAQLDGFGEALGSLGALKDSLIGLTLASGPALLVKENGELATQLKNVAAAADISTTALQVLKLNMAEDGVTVETLTHGLTTLRKNLEDATVNAKSPMNQALEALKLDAAGLQALRPEEQLEVLGERIANATDKNAAFAAAMELLGKKNAPQLLEALQRLGVEGFDMWAEKSKNLTLTDEQLGKLERAGNDLKRIWDNIKLIGAKAEIGVMDWVTATNAKAEADWQKQIQTNPDLAAYKTAQDAQNASDATAAAKAKTEREARAKEEAARMKAASDKAAAEAAAREQQGLLVKEGQKSEKGIADLKEITPEQEAEAAHAAEKLNDELDQQALKFRELIDPTVKYQQAIDQVTELQTAGKLSADEAAKAIDNLKVQMGHDLEHAIDASNESLRGFEESLNGISNNPFLTDIEKHEERVRILKQENAAIEHQIELLKKFANEHPGVDPAAVRGQIRGLQQKQTGNDKTIGAPRSEAMNITQNLHAEMIHMQNAIKTPAHNIAATLTNTIGGAFKSISANISSVIMGTESWHDALLNIGQTLETTLVQGIVNLFMQWIEKEALAWAMSEIFGVTGATEQLTQAGIQSAATLAMWSPAATAASIASYGAAAAIGAAAYEAAIAASLAGGMAGFSVGGYTGDIDPSAVAGLVHGKEFVMDANTTSLLGVDFLNSLRFNAGAMSTVGTTGRGSGATGGSAARMKPMASKPQRTIFLDHRDENLARRMEQDPQFQTTVVRIGQKNRGELGIPVAG